MIPKLKDPTLLRNQAYVAGAWTDAESGRRTEVYNPATGAVITTVPECGSSDAARAVAAAQSAQRAWAACPAKERSAVLCRLHQLMLDHIDDLALILTTEQGKPLAESRGEIVYAASFVDWFAQEARRVYGDLICPPQPDRRLLAIKQPIGVTAAITPWNFPSAMITRKAAPALAAGCAMVVKPAPQTPLSALALAVLAERAGLPAGLFSIVTGDATAIGSELTRNPLVRKLSFTGSTATGRLLMRQCADTVKKLSLELGGNAPFIVFEDADLDAAAEGAIASKFRNTGQTCVCTNRFYVQRSVYEPFAARLVQKVRELRVGVGTEPEGVQQGPLIDARALAKVQAHVDDALALGGELLIGGKPHPLGGTFFEPTVIGHASSRMRLAQEETFGPIAPLFIFDTEDEVLAAANDTEFGLAAYFYTSHSARIWRLSEALEYGMVGVNTGLISTAEAPFGGVKQAGLGREGSRYGLDEYLELKYLCIAGLD